MGGARGRCDASCAQLAATPARRTPQLRTTVEKRGKDTDELFFEQTTQKRCGREIRVYILVIALELAR